MRFNAGKMLVLYTLLSVFCSFGFSVRAIAEPLPESLQQELFSQLDPGQIFELTFPQELQHSTTIKMDEEISIEMLQQYADELVNGGRWAKLFIPIPTTYRRHLESSFKVLILLLKKHQITQLKLADIQAAGAAKIRQMQDSGVIGDCYYINSIEESLLEMARWVCLDHSAQAKIDAVFADTFVFPFTPREKELFLAKKFTTPEIAELRALRRASEIFEQNTTLRDDEAGGFWTNLKGEITGNFQMNCWNRAVTYRAFINRLIQRGLIRHFSIGHLATKRPPLSEDWSQSGHAATGIINTRTLDRYVVDSWYEKGGSPAHILTYDDWLKLPITYWKPLTFNDVVFGP